MSRVAGFVAGLSLLSIAVGAFGTAAGAQVDGLDMAILKFTAADVVAPGETYSYALIIVNQGTEDATGVIVADTVPAGLTVDCDSVFPTPATCDPDTGTLQWGPPLAPDGSTSDPWPAGVPTTFVYEVTVGSPAAADRLSFTNTATVRANGVDVIPEDNMSSAETTLLLGEGGAQSDLSISKDDGVTAVTPGQTVTYTVTVANTGNFGATLVEVIDTLPPATTFVGCAATPPVSCTETAPGVVRAALGTVAGGTQVALAITMMLDDPQPLGVQTVTNQVSVTHDGPDGPDPTPANNTAIDVDQLTTQATTTTTTSSTTTSSTTSTTAAIAPASATTVLSPIRSTQPVTLPRTGGNPSGLLAGALALVAGVILLVARTRQHP